ncbi:hypothetical protein LguiB_032599 [Lonicera macranthoides]
MGKKRKSEATRLDEVDRNMYSTFCSAANSLSQLYTQAMNQQRLSFQAGERHGLEKLYNWILRQHENGSRVTTGDITAYLQNELEYGAEDSPMSPRLPFQNHTQTNLITPVISNSFAPATAGGRSGYSSDHQAKNSSVFSNALSSPVRRSLQHYHLSQGSYYPNNASLPSGNAPRSGDNGFSNTQNSNDTSMDMHDDSPGNESSY